MGRLGKKLKNPYFAVISNSYVLNILASQGDFFLLSWDRSW